MNPLLPYYGVGGGIQSVLGTILPPGAEVRAYVSSNTTYADSYPSEIRNALRSTLNAGLALCRSGRGDVVVVLPGHTESIATADAMSGLVAGTQIVGLGTGNMRPTFTWTAATATFLFDVANVKMYNCILNMAGSRSSTTALSVAAPITISAAGCGFYGCEANVGVDADQLATVAFTTTVAADDLEFKQCFFWGAAGSAVTTVINLVGADRCVMEDVYIIAETSAAAVGVVLHSGTASLQILAERCKFVNLKSDSTACYTAMAASSGVLNNCCFGFYGNSGTTAITAQGDLQVFNSQTVNEQGETGINSTVVSA